MSAAVCLAAMIPARRAACSGSPFLTAPRLIWAIAVRDIETDPRAIASRLVTGLSPTSTMRIRPRRSTCESSGAAFDFRLTAGLRGLFFTLIPVRKIEREALERDCQVDALELHVRWHLQRARRKVQHRLDARGDD